MFLSTDSPPLAAKLSRLCVFTILQSIQGRVPIRLTLKLFRIGLVYARGDAKSMWDSHITCFSKFFANKPFELSATCLGEIAGLKWKPRMSFFLTYSTTDASTCWMSPNSSNYLPMFSNDLVSLGTRFGKSCTVFGCLWIEHDFSIRIPIWEKLVSLFQIIRSPPKWYVGLTCYFVMRYCVINWR